MDTPDSTPDAPTTPDAPVTPATPTTPVVPETPPASSASATPDPLAHLPSWAQDFARRYFTKTLCTFLLSGNVRDLVPLRDPKTASVERYVPLRQFIAEELFAARDLVVCYDRAAGIHFVDQASQRDFNRAVSGYDTLMGTDFAQKLPKDPARVFALLENYFRLRLAEGKRVGCVIDYAETLIPMAEAGNASPEDRASLVALRKWATDPSFLAADFTVVLIAESLRDVNQGFVQSAHVAPIKIAMPTAAERLAFVQYAIKGREDAYKSLADVPAAVLAQNTAGLGYVQLQTIVADIFENRNRLTFERLSEKKKTLIEAEAMGMLEFVESDRDLAMVAGHEHAKDHLRHAAAALKAGRPDVLPMGYLVSGPVGTGKTFLISCFAGEIGIPMVVLKNFRSQWQGQTEGNLEKILTLLQAMTPVAVLIDEADAMLGDRDNEGDSGVSSRVFGQIATFMSNTRNRGRVIFFLVTARPDLMPIDLKRQGRAEEHLALFYPTTREEREELYRVMLRRTDVDLKVEDLPEAMLDGSRTYSGADAEALMTRAKFRAAAEGTPVTPAIFADVVEDFLPPTYPLEVELQTLAAVMECTSRSLLPEKYRAMDREAVVRRIEELKRLVN
ncbi:MAG: ATP-binding protein [Rhodothermales bacterium]|nr:ATP-binding protein [Rhodothermales bacterium]